MITVKTINRSIYARMRDEGFKYFLINGNFYGWFSDFLAINKAGEVWEMTFVMNDSDMIKAVRSKQSRLKACRHLSPSRLPTYSSIVCPYNMVSVSKIPDYAGLFYIAGSDKMSSFQNVKNVKHPEKLTDELMNDTEWLWMIEHTQKEYAKIMLT